VYIQNLPDLEHVLFHNQTKTIAGKKAKVWKKVKNSKETTIIWALF